MSPTELQGCSGFFSHGGIYKSSNVSVCKLINKTRWNGSCSSKKLGLMNQEDFFSPMFLKYRDINEGFNMITLRLSTSYLEIKPLVFSRFSFRPILHKKATHLSGISW